MSRTSLALAACLLAAACSSSFVAARPVDGWDVYGADIRADQDALGVDELLADPAAHDGQRLLLTGTIDEACPVKGCWMTFTDGEQSLRVKFLDYGFFVPLDSAGRTARMEGTFSIREVPLAEARHYLEDAGRHDEAAALTGPQQGYEFVAHGVQLEQTGGGD